MSSERMELHDKATSRVLDLIYRVYPFGAKVEGPDVIEWHLSPFRWFCGSQTIASFELPDEGRLYLRYSAANVLLGQAISVIINDAVVATHENLGVGQPLSNLIEFDGHKSNKIVLRFATTSKAAGEFSGDQRDLAMMFYDFSIWMKQPQEIEATLQSTPRPTVPACLGDPAGNTELNRLEYESGETILKSLPSVVTLALTTYCNNRKPCVICDRNTRSAASDMEIDTQCLERAVPLLQTANYVLLHCGGEAMLSRHFDDVVAIVQPPTRISFATNAMLMTNKRADKMLEKDIMAGFVVSLDAASRQTYEIMRPGSVFDTVIGNVAYYIEQAKRLGRKESNITLNMTLCEANIHEAPQLVDLAASIGAWGVDYNHLNAGLTHVAKTSAGWGWNYVEQAQFKDQEFHDRMLLEAYYRAKEKGIHFSLVGKPFLGENAKKYQEIVCDMTCQVAFQEGEGDSHWKSPHHKKISPNVPSCFKPWQETVIQPGGEVRICYFHKAQEWVVGHLKQQDFMSIWNSDQMVRVREQFLEHAFAQNCALSQPCMHRGRT